MGDADVSFTHHFEGELTFQATHPDDRLHLLWGGRGGATREQGGADDEQRPYCHFLALHEG